MTIEEAVQSLKQRLGDNEVFYVYHNGTQIIVNVNFIYRSNEVTRLGDNWEGFPLTIGRRSCW